MAHKRKTTRPDHLAHTTPADALVGQLLGGNYKLTRIIGAGGNAIVFEARRLKPVLKVAVKVLSPNAADPTLEERFKQEARIARMLRGVNQVAFLDEGEVAPGQPFWVMEFLEGEDLAARLDRLGRLEVPAAMTLAEGVGAALTEAHDLGIVHRDIKPANVFLARGPGGSEAIKVLDFGAAHVQRSDANLTQTGKVVGTPWYMSPEQARGQTLDPRSDQFSLGLLLFQALTGQVPFNAEQATDVLFKIAGDPHPSLLSIEPSLPEEVDPVFDRALAKRADDRYATVAQFVDALRLALGSKPRRRSTVVVKRSDIEPQPKAEAPAVELERALLSQSLLEAEPIAQAQKLAAESHVELADAILQLRLLEEEPLLKAATGPGRRYHLQRRVLSAVPTAEALARLPLGASTVLRVVPLGWSDILSEIRVYSAAPALPDLEEKLKAAAGAQSVSILLALPSAVTALARRAYGLDAPPPAELAKPAEFVPEQAAPAPAPPAADEQASETPLVPVVAAPAVAAPAEPTPSEPMPAAPPARTAPLDDEPEPPYTTPIERRFDAVEFVPGAGPSPVLGRLEDELAHRAVRRAAEALGARHAALVLDQGRAVAHTSRAPLPADVVDALHDGSPVTPWPIAGWSASVSPVFVRQAQVGTLLTVFEGLGSPLVLDTPALRQAVADQVALVLDQTRVLLRRSREIDAWLDGDQGLEVGDAAAIQAPVVVVDLRPLIDAPGDALARLQSLRGALQRAQAIVFAFGGSSVTSSDGLTAVWGTREPGPTDVYRALSCARALASNVVVGPAPRVALTLGEVLLGAGLAPSPCPSILSGTATTAAWKLSARATGRVVVQLEALSHLGGKLEGTAEPVPGVEGAVSISV